MLVKLCLWHRVEIQEMVVPFSLEMEKEHDDYKFEKYFYTHFEENDDQNFYFLWIQKKVGLILQQHDS